MLKEISKIRDVLNKSILILFTSSISLSAQDNVSIFTPRILVEGDSAFFHKALGNINSINSSTLHKRIIEAIGGLKSKGYLTASLDSIDADSTFYVYTGSKYEISRLAKGNLPEEIARKCRLDRKRYSGAEEISKTLECVIERSEESGYPFASVKLDSVELSKGDIYADIKYEKGPLIVYDSIKVSGDTRAKTGFLSRYLHLDYGTVYSEGDVNTISDKLGKLEYLSLRQPPHLDFVRERAIVSLDLKRERVNRFNFLLGFLPNQASDGDLLITGEIDLSLKNLFGKGRKIDLHWERFQQESQRLNLSYYQPLLFSSRFDTQLNFDLLKQDSSFLKRDFDLHIFYPLSTSSQIGIGFYNSNTSTLSGNRFEVNALPEFNSTVIRQGQVTYSFDRILGSEVSNHAIRINANFRGGVRTISRESEVNESVYDSVDLQTPVFNLNVGLETLLKLKGSFYLYYALQARWLETDLIFGNEALRLGGFNSLRGFNEQFFFAEYYVLNNIEARIYYNYDGYFFVFFDQSVLRNAISERNDVPYGIGLGMSLKTKSGIFKFAYAFGQSDEQDFNTRNGKIHFGYTATF